MAQSKRIVKEVVSSTGVTVEMCHCRKCRMDKNPGEFYTATDTFLDTSGYMSICKKCVNDLYERYFQLTQSVDKTILSLCRLLNVKYDEKAIDALHAHLQTFEDRGKESQNIFGIYKTKLVTVQSISISERTKGINDFTFVEPNRKVIESMKSDDSLDIKYLEKMWGKSPELNQEDYEFLDNEYGRWVGPIGNVTHGEEILIRDICHLQNQIRKERILGNDGKVNNLIEARQKIMKDGALTPLLQNAANSGKNADCFGVWLRDIEQTKPADYYENQEKYKDMDGIQEDIQDIKRSAKNFLTGSHDFGSIDLESINDIENEDGE
jgi:hypothetical protein